MAKMSLCSRPPRGWRCNRPDGHRGPCPTYPTRWMRILLWLTKKAY